MDKSNVDIDVFATKYGADRLRRIKVVVRGEEVEMIARVPDRVVIGEFEKYIDRDPAKAKDILIKNCLLTHMELVDGDDDLYFAVGNAMSELFPKVNVRVMLF